MSNGYKDVLIAAKERAPSAFAEYLQTATSVDTVVAFVEGADDEAFYYHYLNSMSNDVVFIRCNTKNGVLKARVDVNRKFDRKPCRAKLFFCDLDFDAISGVESPDDIFRTEFYSIESYLVSEEFFQSVLARRCGFTRARDRQKLARMLLDGIRRSAAELVSVFGAMFVERSTLNSADFDSLPLNRFIDIDLEEGRVILKRTLREILVDLSLNPDVEPIVQERCAQMLGVDFRIWFRGRHLWQLVRRIVSEFFRDSVPRAFEDAFSINGLREFSQTVPAPADLANYLMRRTAAP